MPTKSCLTCGYRTLNPLQCPLIEYKYQDDRNPCCPYWVAEVPICANCGRVDPNYTITINSHGESAILCSQCSSVSGTCLNCTESSNCDYETNPSPLPKAVQKTIRQGNQIMSVTVKNEERIRETCQKNCECWNEELGCCRAFNCCSNYQEKEFENNGKE